MKWVPLIYINWQSRFALNIYNIQITTTVYHKLIFSSQHLIPQTYLLLEHVFAILSPESTCLDLKIIMTFYYKHIFFSLALRGGKHANTLDVTPLSFVQTSFNLFTLFFSLSISIFLIICPNLAGPPSLWEAGSHSHLWIKVIDTCTTNKWINTQSID